MTTTDLLVAFENCAMEMRKFVNFTKARGEKLDRIADAMLNTTLGHASECFQVHLSEYSGPPEGVSSMDRLVWQLDVIEDAIHEATRTGIRDFPLEQYTTG